MPERHLADKFLLDSQTLKSTGSWEPQIWIDGIYRCFSSISTRVLLGQISPGSAKADIRWGENLNCYSVDSCVRNICAEKFLKFDNYALSYNQKCE